MSTRILESVVTDVIKNHPAMFIFALAMAGGVLYFSYSTFALKKDLISVQTAITERLIALELKAEIRDINTQIRTLEAEAFELERIERAHEATRRDLQRQKKVNKEIGRLERGLDHLKKEEKSR